MTEDFHNTEQVLEMLDESPEQKMKQKILSKIENRRQKLSDQLENGHYSTITTAEKIARMEELRKLKTEIKPF